MQAAAPANASAGSNAIRLKYGIDHDASSSRLLFQRFGNIRRIRMTPALRRLPIVNLTDPRQAGAAATCL